MKRIDPLCMRDGGKNRWRPALKALTIAIVVLIMLIPISMVKSIVDDRQRASLSACNDIEEKMGGQGPYGFVYVHIPIEYSEYSYDEKGARHEQRIKSAIIVSPETLRIWAQSHQETRARGIYKVPVYTADVNMEVEFAYLPTELQDLANLRVDLRETRLIMEIGDPRALDEQATISLGDGSTVALKSCNPILARLPKAISAPVKLIQNQDGTLRGAFGLSMRVRGANGMYFLPTGGFCETRLSGDWPSPSFDGYRLPRERELSAKGFSATWFSEDSARILASVAYLHDLDLDNLCHGNNLDYGVSFIKAVNVYSQSYRALHYAVLFLFMPFAFIFLLELRCKREIHVLQYLIIGLCDVIFYLLLIAISEHLDFMLSYAISSLGVSLAMGLYLKAILPGLGKSWGFLGFLVLEYGFLYLTLSSEDYALLLGAVGLFCLILLAMVFTRSIGHEIPRKSSDPGDGLAPSPIPSDAPGQE